MMMTWTSTNPVLAAGLALVLLGLLWLALTRRRRAPQRREYRDVLSEGAGPAQRNTALIDAAPAAAVAPPPAPEAPPPADGDDLTRIKGIGPKLHRLLTDLGVTRFDQIAAWSEADLAALDPKLGAFAGRPARDNWVEQAALLASGDAAAYEARFGKL